MTTHRFRSAVRWSLTAGLVSGVILVAATTAHATGSTNKASGFSSTDVITSGDTVSRSMVAGSSPTSLGSFVPPAQTKAAATTSSASDTGFDGVGHSGVIATLYSKKTGAVLAKQRFPASTEGQKLSLSGLLAPAANGSGGTSSSSGCIKVTVWQDRRTLLGFFAAKAWIWTDWCWQNNIQRVYINRTGNGHDQASGYSFDGWGAPHKYFYDWGPNNGYPKSAYHYDQEGAFTSPGCCGAQGHWYPKQTLDSHRDGTWTWYTSS